jgi:hypothetical protein
MKKKKKKIIEKNFKLIKPFFLLLLKLSSPIRSNRSNLRSSSNSCQIVKLPPSFQHENVFVEESQMKKKSPFLPKSFSEIDLQNRVTEVENEEEIDSAQKEENFFQNEKALTLVPVGRKSLDSRLNPEVQKRLIDFQKKEKRFQIKEEWWLFALFCLFFLKLWLVLEFFQQNRLANLSHIFLSSFFSILPIAKKTNPKEILFVVTMNWLLTNLFLSFDDFSLDSRFGGNTLFFFFSFFFVWFFQSFKKEKQE